MADGSERQVRLKIDAGGEQVELLRLEATEGLSQHFDFAVDVLAPLGEVDWLRHLGKPVVISTYEDDQLLRHFHGLVVDASYMGELIGNGGFCYRLRLRPQGFLHEQGTYFRIFQDKTVKQILEDMLTRCGIAKEFGKLSGGARMRSYCVQYDESDFDFICRLMEEEGIYYFYRHTPEAHTLVLCDGANSHDKAGVSPLTYSPDSLGVFNTDSAARTASASNRYIQSWHERVSTCAEHKVTMRDYDFLQSPTPLESFADEKGAHDEDVIEVYTYPGRFYAKGEGTALSQTALKSYRANRRILTGESKCGGIECGTTFKLDEHPNSRFNKQYMLTHVSHSYATEQHRSGMDQTASSGASFEAVPADVQWRAPMTTPRPVVAGMQTAIVVGKAGKTADVEGGTLDVDLHGRVLVQFHWDRDGKLDEKSSCRLRVSQTGLLGNMIIPRTGHEVLVGFINGDPDRPIIVGRLYNNSRKPIYGLPAEETKAVWRSLRVGAAGAYDKAEKLDVDRIPSNEISFEDKGGSEQLFMHAQRDMKTRVQLDESHHVGRDQHVKVGYDRKVDVKNNETIEVKEHRKTKIGKTDTLEILNLLDTKVTNGDEKRNISGTQEIEVGKTIKIKAGTSITLECGQSKIVMDATSITITSLTIDVKADMAATMKSLNTTVDGTAMTTIKGGIVMIN